MANQGTQGGSHEQHVKAGQETHKNTGKSSDSSKDDHQQQQKASEESHKKADKPSDTKGTQGGSHEQHVKAGQQSHKNS